MNKTSQLHYRILIKNAATYVKYILETDPDILAGWSQFYHTGDVQVWARERINNLLAAADEITIDETARAAVVGARARLALAGYSEG